MHPLTLAAELPHNLDGKILLLNLISVGMVAAGIFCIRGLWLIFEKAGQQGWKAVVPVYHHVIITRVAGVSAWWNLALLLVYPLLKAQKGGAKVLCATLLLVWWGWLCQRIARRFGKSRLFALGMTLPVLGFFFRTALAYDKSTYDPQA
ncbi:MAG: DUF5684 domain-containing protein [Opitutales bacterium]